MTGHDCCSLTAREARLSSSDCILHAYIHPFLAVVSWWYVEAGWNSAISMSVCTHTDKHTHTAETQPTRASQHCMTQHLAAKWSFLPPSPPPSYILTFPFLSSLSSSSTIPCSFVCTNTKEEGSKVHFSLYGHYYANERRKMIIMVLASAMYTTGIFCTHSEHREHTGRGCECTCVNSHLNSTHS